MDVSIIIPTYKPQDYIYECLDSIKKQVLDPSEFEAIIILNGCNEPWLGNLNNYIKNNLSGHNIRLIHTDVPGVSNARNIGIEAAKGNYITFVDDDDYISPQYLSEMLAKIDPTTVVLSNSQAFYDGGNLYPNYHMRNAYNRLSKLSDRISITQARMLFNVPYMKLIPKRIISDVRFNVNFKNGEDSLFMYEISKNISNIKICGINAIYFRRYRVGSAVTNPRTVTKIIIDAVKLSNEFAKSFFKAPRKYNILFTATRVLAPIKSLLREIKFNKSITKKL